MGDESEYGHRYFELGWAGNTEVFAGFANQFEPKANTNEPEKTPKKMIEPLEAGKNQTVEPSLRVLGRGTK